MGVLLRRVMQWWAAREVRKYFEEQSVEVKRQGNAGVDPVENPASDHSNSSHDETSTYWREQLRSNREEEANPPTDYQLVRQRSLADEEREAAKQAEHDGQDRGR